MKLNAIENHVADLGARVIAAELLAETLMEVARDAGVQSSDLVALIGRICDRLPERETDEAGTVKRAKVQLQSWIEHVQAHDSTAH